MFLASYAIHVLFQVYYEFSRVVGKSLQENFFDELDRFSPRLMDLFRKKKGLTGQLLAELLRQTKVGLTTLVYYIFPFSVHLNLSFLSSLLFIFFFLSFSFLPSHFPSLIVSFSLFIT